jgi:hypothetical protein
MSDADHGAILGVSDHVIATLIEDEFVLLDSRHGTFFSLGGAGVQIWQILAAGGATREDVVSRLVQAFDAEEARVRLDVEMLLRHLSDHGLLQSQS